MTLAKIPWRAGRDGANARVMAAAVLLLEAAEEVLACREDGAFGEDGYQGIKLLRAAVAAAKGES